jgi:hypothetical protein
LENSHAAMYADDTNITVGSDGLNNLEKTLNHEMSNIHQWLVSNKLTLNMEKTEYMVIGTHKRLSRFSQDINVSIDGKVIKQVNSKKTLGVIIDENLCWDKQIENISKKVSKGIGMLRRIKPFVSIGTLAYFYQALVQPHFDYCSMVWGNCGKTLKGMLQKLQNRAARVISGDSYEVRSLDILSKLNWKTLEERRNEQQLKCVSKALACQCPENISNMFIKSNSERYDLRSNNSKLVLTKPKTKLLKNIQICCC